MKVFVIGAGASGLVSAIIASRKGNDVTIIEKNSNLGKKLLITGNGKCNYWNSDQNLSHYHSSNIALIEKIITDENKNNILDFFDSIGIVPKIKNGYYYPYSEVSTAVQSALVKEIGNLGIKVINEEVINIEYDCKFLIKTNNKTYKADKVVIATGSKASPKTGSTGFGYAVAPKFGHNIIKVLPALTGLKINDKFVREWAGIRVDASVSLYENDRFVKKEDGQLQLTNYGVSGICVFQLSRFVSIGLDKGKKEALHINFIPSLNFNSNSELVSWLSSRNYNLKNRNITELLDSIINYKLVYVILKQSGINKDSHFDDLSNNQKQTLAANLLDFKIDIVGTNSFDNSQVCTGGIKLDEVNPRTMESLKQKGLYFVGEVLDVDGDCGGYNLSFAFITGMLAGLSIGE